MAVHFPDVSHFQAGLKLDGATAAIAKASEGTDWTDASYVDFRRQAATLGIPFLSYHFLRVGNIADQVAHCKAVTGDVPLMLDVEKCVDGSVTSLAEALEFIDLHGRVVLAYIPHWYWRDYWHSPDLTGLTKRGAGLISSYYTTYSDTGPGWQPYGGVTPQIWQYTSSQPFNGMQVDFNAYEGTVDELRRLWGLEETDMTPDQSSALVDCLNILTAMANGLDTATVHDKDGVLHLSQFYARVAAEVAKLPADSSGVVDHTHAGGTTGPVAPAGS